MTCVLPVRARPLRNVLPAIVTSRVLLRTAAAPFTVEPNIWTVSAAVEFSVPLIVESRDTSEAPVPTVTLLTVAPCRQVTPVVTLTLFCVPVSVVVQVASAPGSTVAL